jgi:chromosome partitioning protein
MIITFATQKAEPEKLPLPLRLPIIFSIVSERSIKVYDFDFQKSFYSKWLDDEESELPKLYDVEVIGEDEQNRLSGIWKKSSN